MTGKLNTFVHVRDEAGESTIFGPNSTVPEWAAAKITNPDVWATAPAATPAPAEEPPRGGKGSGTDAWREYAVNVLHLTVEGDAERDDIIALVDASKES